MCADSRDRFLPLFTEGRMTWAFQCRRKVQTCSRRPLVLMALQQYVLMKGVTRLAKNFSASCLGSDSASSSTFAFDSFSLARFSSSDWAKQRPYEFAHTPMTIITRALQKKRVMEAVIRVPDVTRSSYTSSVIVSRTRRVVRFEVERLSSVVHGRTNLLTGWLVESLRVQLLERYAQHFDRLLATGESDEQAAIVFNDVRIIHVTFADQVIQLVEDDPVRTDRQRQWIAPLGFALDTST